MHVLSDEYIQYLAQVRNCWPMQVLLIIVKRMPHAWKGCRNPVQDADVFKLNYYKQIKK